MNKEIWQQLLSLENRDITQKWFNQIHGRELNLRRSIEINAASRQAREYFRNANNSSNSVRPLLTFYGVASLSRALLLLLRCNGGEETLKAGHGLMTVDWGNTLSGDLSKGLSSLGELKISTCSGLFSDFLKETENRISIHLNSSGVDWKLNYNIPELNKQITLFELFERIPDLERDYLNIEKEIKYAPVSQMTYSSEKGFNACVNAQQFEGFKNIYENLGYEVNKNGNLYNITCNQEIFAKNLPLILHKYIYKTFGTIPALYIVEPFQNMENYSQLSVTYIIAYFLGMLVRYYPTHWISLVQGEKGDSCWPLLNRAQHFVEATYPELVIELITDILKEKKS